MHFWPITIQNTEEKKNLGDCSICLSSNTETPSFQTGINEFKAVLFEQDELEHRDNILLIAFLPVLTNQQSQFELNIVV